MLYIFNNGTNHLKNISNPIGMGRTNLFEGERRSSYSTKNVEKLTDVKKKL